MNNIQIKSDKEDFESSLIELQNKLERLKDDFNIEKISKKEFNHWTQIYKIRLEEIQRALDILEEEIED